jgi:hypothetical protein
MAIKEILDRIKAKLGSDDSEATALVADAIREANDIMESLQSANKESASRKTKIRELESELEKSKDEVTKLSGQDNKAELDRLRKVELDHQTYLKAEDDKLRAAWEQRAAIFAIPETDKRHAQIQKIKPDFAFAEGDTPLAIDAIKNNMRLADTLSKAGVFDEPKPQPAQGTPPISTSTPTHSATSGEAVLNLLNLKKS